MSRIGKKPVEILAGVTVSVAGSTINVEGPAGKLSFEHRPEVTVEVNSDDNIVLVDRINEHRESRAFHGLTRALINNMIIGVKEGYEKRLEIVGVGYRGSLQGKTLTLSLGLSHPVEIEVPEGLDIKMDGNTKFTISGADKQKLGQFAAVIRSKRPPEPFKGKGIRYANEFILRKEGKKK